MLVPLEGYQHVWQQIKQESMSHSTYRVVVFVACLDVDAFAAGRMLGALLRKHLILHKMKPVVGYRGLRDAFRRLDDGVRNVILVGCGGNVDLDELFGLSEDAPRAKIHVFDRVRPWNLNNLFGSEEIFCYDDGGADLEPYRAAYDFLATDLGAGEADIDEINSASEGSEGSDGGNELREAKRRRLVDDDEGDASDRSDRSDGTQEDEVPADPVLERAKKRRASQRRAHLALLEEYYRQGAHLAVTNAIQVYTLLTLIGETTAPALWLAVLGLTAVEAQHPELYRQLLPSLRDEMMRLNTYNDLSLGSGAAPASRASRGDLASRAIRFHSESDYSLFLLRQWSLYESMVHSSYVSAKLFLWREDGRRKLHKLLARMGVTLQDSRESWIHTSPSLKRELRAKLAGVQSIYGLDGIIREGAVRQFGLKGVMSAGDCVEGLAAFLETGSTESGSVLARDSVGQDTNDAPDGRDAAEARQDAWVRNFWTAWDAVDNYDRLHAGTDQAKALQAAVVATANYIFEKNLPKDLHSFRMVIVQEAPELDVFLNPLSLQRLAGWISESCAELHNSATPLVLAVLNEPANAYLVFGMAPQKTREQPEAAAAPNHFGRHFQETAAEIHARIRVDAFESAIVEVGREDLPRFLEALDSHL